MKVRGTTITTPVPKSVYYLDYHEGYGWGVDGVDYKGAISALGKGQVVILRISPVADAPMRYFVCTERSSYDYLVFFGTDREEVTAVLVSPEGLVDWLRPGNTSAIREDIEVLKSRLDSMPFKELVGTSSNPVTLRDLESGVYLITGTIRGNYSGGKSTCNGDIFIVVRDDAYGYTYAYKFVPSIISIGRYAITDSAVSYTSYKLSDITSLLSRVTALENRLAALGV